MAFTKVWTETDERQIETERTEVRRVEQRVWVRESFAEKSSPSSESVISRLRVYRKNPVN